MNTVNVFGNIVLTTGSLTVALPMEGNSENMSYYDNILENYPISIRRRLAGRLHVLEQRRANLPVPFF